MKWIIILISASLILASAVGCHKETEQERVRKVIVSIQKAAEEKEIKKITGALSETYSDSQGNNHAAIKRLLIAYFYQYPNISVYITKLNVSADDRSGRAVFQALLTSKQTGTPTAAVLPESLGLYEFDVALTKESGEWKVVSARWEKLQDTQ